MSVWYVSMMAVDAQTSPQDVGSEIKDDNQTSDCREMTLGDVRRTWCQGVSVFEGEESI
jgi:hypothetical protein